MVCALPHFFLLVKSHRSTRSYTGVVAPSPACRRALQTVVSLLEQDGHEVTAMSTLVLISPFIAHSDPPSPLKALQIGSQLMANACELLSVPAR
jgi:hypothetical protein